MKTFIKRFSILLLFLFVFLYAVSWVMGMPDKSMDYLQNKYANAPSQFMEINELNVHYRVEGSGPNLVLIHGTASSLHTWDAWTDDLQDSFRIIRMDLPAFGLTGPNAEHDYSIEAYVDFVDTFLEKLGVETFHVAGNSLGGRIAWHYALTHPDKVDKMILIDAAGYPMVVPTIFKIAQTPILNKMIKDITPRTLVENNIKEVFYDDTKISDELVDRYFELTLRAGNRDAFIARAKQKFQDNTNQLANIEEPTLIMWGKHDEWIPVEHGMRMDQSIPNSTLKIYSNAGHVPMEEIAEETAADARVFLSQNGN